MKILQPLAQLLLLGIALLFSGLAFAMLVGQQWDAATAFGVSSIVAWKTGGWDQP